jgi:hypothetical protein
MISMTIELTLFNYVTSKITSTVSYLRIALEKKREGANAPYVLRFIHIESHVVDFD